MIKELIVFFWYNFNLIVIGIILEEDVGMGIFWESRIFIVEENVVKGVFFFY